VELFGIGRRAGFRSPFTHRSGGPNYPERTITKNLMSKITRTVAFLLALAVLPAAWAAIGREEAASLAQQKTPGRVLAVERGVHVDNSIVWHVKMVTAAGEIRLVVIDAATGRAR
jgi:uncharacterized membrane protein YkoI